MNPVIGLALVLVAVIALNVRARLEDRRWRNAGRGWKLPRRVRPVARFKSKLRAITWGEFENVRSGQPERDEPEKVPFPDVAGFIRLWPNPGFQIAGRHWCRNPKCPTPWKVG